METIELSRLTLAQDGVYLLNDRSFSGFAIETFQDGDLQTQMALMHGRQDGVTRRWHPQRPSISTAKFGSASADAERIVAEESTWREGEVISALYFDEFGRVIQEIHSLKSLEPATTRWFEYSAAGELVASDKNSRSNPIPEV